MGQANRRGTYEKRVMMANDVQYEVRNKGLRLAEDTTDTTMYSYKYRSNSKPWRNGDLEGTVISKGPLRSKHHMVFRSLGVQLRRAQGKSILDPKQEMTFEKPALLRKVA